MPILHGVSLSPFVRKVRVVLAEKGIAYDQEPVMPFGQSEEFMKISPLGKIPVYQEGDFALPDSSCIVAYLERIHPEPALYPGDPKEFARALWYEEYCDTRLVESTVPVFFQRFVRPNVLKQEPDEELAQKALNEQLPPVLDYLEGEIGDRDVLVGSHFSVADIAATSPFVNLALCGERVDTGRWPRLAAYIDRVHARPCYKAILEGEKAALGR
jgi:glutathione S-transferase